MKDPVIEILKYKGSQIHSIQPESTIREAVSLMKEQKIGSLLVLHNDELIGMLTERDILFRVVDTGKSPDTTNVHEVMSLNVITIKPSLQVEQALKIITEKHVRHLPVIENGRRLGMVSSGDLINWLVREQAVYIENLLDYINGEYPR